ncbi:MAG: hypothetical protein CMH91_01625 [Oceanicaulis sp.]|uniref:hypothetical protein n=1 Tax=unclassified Oceanicaulis TaxID=2632123 RepID=UPI000C6636C1|nr:MULTISPECIES: hypothetical protein [unclassified Oceanicaulis]MBC37748.1 hypothetical protein [Oceanicaulis sp.]MBG36905.1 hypothetical protein [Oceanicaulis sp.]HBU63294.1 hypothetical protein [Oceanicaulis sp.]
MSRAPIPPDSRRRTPVRASARARETGAPLNPPLSDAEKRMIIALFEGLAEADHNASQRPRAAGQTRGTS